MSAWLKPVAAALALVFVAHALTLHLYPRLAAGAAIDRIGRDGALVNLWVPAERVTAATRAPPRPSPDFAAAACVFDLRGGPVLIATPGWDDYWSLSLYAADGANFFVVNDREAPGGVEITLTRAGRRAPEDARQTVQSPTARGVAILRRLAPNADAFAAAGKAARADVCAPLS